MRLLVLWACCLLIVTTALGAGSSDDLIDIVKMSRSDPRGNFERITYEVTREELKELSGFDPLKSDPPLTVRQAAEAAIRSRPQSEKVRVTEVRLQRSKMFTFGELSFWYYDVGVAQHEGWEERVIVLLNGRVVEPSIDKLTREEYERDRFPLPPESFPEPAPKAEPNHRAEATRGTRREIWEARSRTCARRRAPHA